MSLTKVAVSRVSSEVRKTTLLCDLLRNAGWRACLYYGFDEAPPQHARRFSPVRGRSDLFSGNVQYKLNPWVTFAFEQGYYRTRAANRSASDFGGLPLFREIPSYTSHNVRSEFATIFTFQEQL
jgi:hypothetical protein